MFFLTPDFGLFISTPEWTRIKTMVEVEGDSSEFLSTELLGFFDYTAKIKIVDFET